MKKYFFLFLPLFLWPSVTFARQQAAPKIPAVYSNIYRATDGRLYIQKGNKKFFQKDSPSRYSLAQMLSSPRGATDGINFDFGPGLNGTLYYGFINYADSKHPVPVYFKHAAKIVSGKASVNIKKRLSGKYDMIGWEQAQKGTLGYRVANGKGEIIYDGIVGFKGVGPFEIDDTIVEGPFVNKMGVDGAVISFDTNLPIVAQVRINGMIFKSADKQRHHEITISGLAADHTYRYIVQYGHNKQEYSLHTAPKAGSRTAFTFSYSSDSRSGQGGGERDLHGTNFYMMRKIMALNSQQNVAFAQFTGDLINGYLNNRGEMELEYANWKRAIEPFAHHFMVSANMGNHENFNYLFDDGSKYGITIDRFPFATESAEKLFADNFVNPENGPDSEDGATYDPNPKHTDFPSYRENAFYYTYDNVAIVTMNSDYWYCPSKNEIPTVSGGLHGYIMDNQLNWLKATLKNLQADENIDHVFITEHTPFFPNGGHSGDDMWYHGNNKIRPYVAGKPVKYGIIERRDQLLDLIVNHSPKVAAILTGDEHNYNKLKIGPKTPIYPEGYPMAKRIKLKRTIFQVNNGAAGAPYYAQEKLPWSAFTSGFTTQNALVLFHIKGKTIKMNVLNPESLEEIDQLELR